MKFVPKQRPFEVEERKEVEEALSSEFDVERLLDQGGEILRREIKNLMMESSGKKLSPTSARDLVAYIRLLSELRAQEVDTVEGLTDEELKELSEKK